MKYGLLIVTIWLCVLPSTGAVERPIALTVSEFRQSLLWSAITKDEQVIEEMDDRINALPPLPQRERWHCREDDGNYYELVFLYADGERSIIKIQRTGCQFVTFEDNKRPALWATEAPPLFRKLDSFCPTGNSYYRKIFTPEAGKVEIGTLTQTLTTKHKMSHRDRSTAYYYRGCAYEKIGENDKAVLDFDKAIKLAPKDFAPYDERAEAYLHLGKKIYEARLAKGS